MISPQGYNLGEEPKSKNPFWDGEGEDSDVNRIYATATVDENVGTPSVQTTKSVDGHDITFGFNFRNLKGRDGTNGTDGSDGVSPTITVADITGGHRVSITDASGTHAFNVMNGTDGQDGRDGTNGTDGRDGTDGVSPSVSVSDITGGHRITVTDATGSETFDVMNGTDGQNGQNGQDGVSPTVSVTSITGGHQVSITDAQGTDTFNVMDGTDGQNGQNGQDGVTPDITMTATADATSSANPTVTVTKGGTTANPTFALAFSGLKGEQGTAGANGQGVPTGGTAGQVLAKIDGTDYNTEWITPSGGGGGGAGLELVLTVPASTINISAFFAELGNVLNDGDRICIECVNSMGIITPFVWDTASGSSFSTSQANFGTSYSRTVGTSQSACIPPMRPYLFKKNSSEQALTSLSQVIETNVSYPPITSMWRYAPMNECTFEAYGAYLYPLSTGFSIIASDGRKTMATSRSSNEIRVYRIGMS